MGEREYPSIERQIRAVRLAPHGCKRAKEKRLVKMRLASLKREIRALSPRSVDSRSNEQGDLLQ